jgi:hypothetical protein
MICVKAEAGNGGKLLKCSACHMAKYCSLSCQRSVWKSHKRLYKKWAKYANNTQLSCFLRSDFVRIVADDYVEENYLRFLHARRV